MSATLIPTAPTPALSDKFLAWLREPSTLTGLSALLGVGSALIGKQITWQQAIPLALPALVLCGVHDNTYFHILEQMFPKAPPSPVDAPTQTLIKDGKLVESPVTDPDTHLITGIALIHADTGKVHSVIALR